MRGPCGSLLLRATLPESTGWKPSEIPSQTRSVSVFHSGRLSVGPRSFSNGAHGPRLPRLVDWAGLDWREESGVLGEHGISTKIET